MKNDYDNTNNYRLEVNPLIEENMLQMEDSEFAISQLTGHLTIKKERKYISKTKELLASSVDVNEFYNDLKDKYDEFINTNNGIDDKIHKFEEDLRRAHQLVEDMYRKLEEYERKLDQLEKDINDLDDYIMNDLLPKVMDDFGYTISSNMKLLAQLLVQYELLDRIIDNESYFRSFVLNMFNTVNENGQIVNLNTITVHEDNKIEIEKRVNKADYYAFCRGIEQKYKDVATANGIKGSYKIKP